MAPVMSPVWARLRPLFVASFLGSVGLWVPIEKLFMSDIGFGAGTVAVMAAAYAAVVPLLEVPSGVLADRWSRRGVLVIANVALAVSAIVGGVSTNVATYVVAAMILGVFFAMNSGTVDSIVYDTVLEETGSGAGYERVIGRVRLLESAALALSALAGGVLAEWLSLRATYFLTVPFVAAAIVALLALREPQLHRTEESTPLREQLAATYRTLLQRGTVRHVIVVAVLSAVLMQALLEFGPLWMVALGASAALYGPHWAGLTGALGLGGLLGGRLDLRRKSTGGALLVIVAAALAALVASRVVVVTIVAQVVLMLLVVAVGIQMSGRLHDAVPSTLRAGVSSGVGTLSWLTFLPFALVFGAVSDRSGVRAAGWAFALVVAVMALGLVLVIRGSALSGAASPPSSFAADRFLPDDDPEWPGHWAVPPADWTALGPEIDSTIVLGVARDAVAGLSSPFREVIVRHDVEGSAIGEICAELGLDEPEARRVLDLARGHVRAMLERHFDTAPAPTEEEVQ
jgi:MFS family permease